MPNPKKYDRTEVLDKAVEVFRRQGFNGTSAADLAEELGINRKSMYAEFASKQGLFEAALERYHEKHLTRVLAILDTAEAGTDEIKTAFRGYASASEGRFRGLGCLMCNTAVERSALDPASGRHVANYFARFRAGFNNALRNSQLAGKISSSIDTYEMAQYLTTCMVGISAAIRAEAPSEQIWATSNVVIRTIDALGSG